MTVKQFPPRELLEVGSEQIVEQILTHGVRFSGHGLYVIERSKLVRALVKCGFKESRAMEGIVKAIRKNVVFDSEYGEFIAIHRSTK